MAQLWLVLMLSLASSTHHTLALSYGQPDDFPASPLLAAGNPGEARASVDAGAEVNIDPSAIPQEVMRMAFETMASQPGSNFAWRTVDINDATTQQVVGGSIYRFTVVLAETNCRTTSQDFKNLNQNCDVRAGAPRAFCDVRVYFGVREKQASAQCDNITSSGSLPDGPTPINPTAIPLGATEFALSEVESTSNSTWTRKVLEIRDASKQIVDGTVYRFKMVLGQTNCRKDGSDQENCAIRRGAPKETCKVTVWVGLKQSVQVECQERLWQGYMGARSLMISDDCPFYYNKAMADYEEFQKYYEGNPLITSTANICRQLCKKDKYCDRWSWVEMGIKHGGEAAYFDGRARHECLLRSGGLIEENLVKAFGVISGSRKC